MTSQKHMTPITKITGTRSYIMVEFGARSLKIAGELTLTPAFYADAASIKNWEAPHQGEPITASEKQEIIERILAYDAAVKIFFED